MIIIRITKVMMIAAIAAFAAYDNIIDYDSNYEFVKHVLNSAAMR